MRTARASFQHKIVWCAWQEPKNRECHRFRIGRGQTQSSTATGAESGRASEPCLYHGGYKGVTVGNAWGDQLPRSNPQPALTIAHGRLSTQMECFGTGLAIPPATSSLARSAANHAHHHHFCRRPIGSILDLQKLFQARSWNGLSAQRLCGMRRGPRALRWIPKLKLHPQDIRQQEDRQFRGVEVFVGLRIHSRLRNRSRNKRSVLAAATAAVSAHSSSLLNLDLHGGQEV